MARKSFSKVNNETHKRLNLWRTAKIVYLTESISVERFSLHDPKLNESMHQFLPYSRKYTRALRTTGKERSEPK
jgi:hypothetical protein